MPQADGAVNTRLTARGGQRSVYGRMAIAHK